jgi:hypothetical protein
VSALGQGRARAAPLLRMEIGERALVVTNTESPMILLRSLLAVLGLPPTHPVRRQAQARQRVPVLTAGGPQLAAAITFDQLGAFMADLPRSAMKGRRADDQAIATLRDPDGLKARFAAMTLALPSEREAWQDAADLAGQASVLARALKAAVAGRRVAAMAGLRDDFNALAAALRRAAGRVAD